MIGLVRALPQGMFWYPLLFFMALALLRAIWSVRVEFGRNRRSEGSESDHVAALAHLVERARTDGFGYQELERRCIGLLLQASGYSGYSVENCRTYASEAEGAGMADVIQDHLANSGPGRSGGSYSIGDPADRVNLILSEVERITEVSSG